MNDQGLGVTDIGEVREDPEAFDEPAARFSPTLDTEGQDRPATVRQELRRSLVIRVVRQFRIADPGHLVPPVKELHHLSGVLDVSLHADRQGFGTLQDVEGVLGGQRGPEVTQPLDPGPDDEGLGPELPR